MLINWISILMQVPKTGCIRKTVRPVESCRGMSEISAHDSVTSGTVDDDRTSYVLRATNKRIRRLKCALESRSLCRYSTVLPTLIKFITLSYATAIRRYSYIIGTVTRPRTRTLYMPYLILTNLVLD